MTKSFFYFVLSGVFVPGPKRGRRSKRSGRCYVQSQKVSVIFDGDQVERDDKWEGKSCRTEKERGAGGEGVHSLSVCRKTNVISR